jgi:phage baseplate assembly protein W
MADLGIVARETVYSDVDFSFRLIPVSNALALKKDEEAVKQSVVNILSTNKGERPFLPYFGSNIRSYLFENFDNVTATLVEEEIRSALVNYEPRVRVTNVEVDGRPDNNSLNILLEFDIISPRETSTSVNFVVERLR